MTKLKKFLQELNKKIELYAKESFSGKITIEINFSQGGINSAKIIQDELMRF